jgi:hypothetical protein
MQYFLPGFEPPGYTTADVIIRINAASDFVEYRLHNHYHKGVRAPCVHDTNQRFWVWLSDCVPAPEGLEHLKTWTARRAIKHQRKKFLLLLRDLVAQGVIESAGRKPHERFRVKE